MAAPILLAAVLLAQWAQQILAKEPARSDLVRREFEAGVAYVDGPAATVINPCLADDWSVVFDWGDGTGPAIPVRRDAPQQPCGGSGCVPAGGPYALWSDHVYAESGKYFARVEPRIHCFGAHGGAVPYPSGFGVTVYRRVALSRVAFSRSSATTGDSVTLRVRLMAAAPPSGTRVDLRATPAGATWVPKFVDVKPGMQEATASLVVEGPPGTTSVEATTVPGRPLRLNLKVRAGN